MFTDEEAARIANLRFAGEAACVWGIKHEWTLTSATPTLVARTTNIHRTVMLALGMFETEGRLLLADGPYQSVEACHYVDLAAGDRREVLVLQPGRELWARVALPPAALQTWAWAAVIPGPVQNFNPILAQSIGSLNWMVPGAAPAVPVPRTARISVMEV